MKSNSPLPDHSNSVPRAQFDATGQLDAIRQRCHLYLLGDLSEAETLAFENDLADPTVADALERESNLLVSVVQASVVQASVVQASVVDEADALSLESSSLAFSATDPFSSQPKRSRQVARVLCSLMAIAAALMVAVIYERSGTNSESDNEGSPLFDMAITESWLQSAIEWDSQEYDWSQDLDFDNQTSEGGPSDDSIAWMVAAVEVARQTPEQNDG